MTTVPITLDLSPELAQIFKEMSPDEQRKLGSLLALWLQEFKSDDGQRLSELMDAISERAQQRGLTPEILESLLADEG